MSPSKFQNSEVTKGVIHGPHSPLSVNRDPHKIQKSCSPKQPVRQQPQPVIIYTLSPKVIHATPRNFMTIVQRLTGLEWSEDEKMVKSESESTRDESSLSEEKDCIKNIGYEETETSSFSIFTDDQKFLGEIKQESCHVSPMVSVSNPYLVDPSLFAPRSNELFYSSSPNSFFQSTSMTNSYSSSYMDFLKEIPEC